MAGLAAGATVAFVAGLLAKRVGPRLGFLDLPDDPALKAHQLPAVPLGGVAIFLGLLVGLLIVGHQDPGFLVASALMLGLGLLDDRRGLSPWARLTGEAAVAVTLVLWADMPLPADPAGLLVGVVIVVGCVNAVNLLDGLDGLAGSVGLVAGLGIAALASLRGTGALEGLVLAGALAGFLILNWHPARIFLGDNGAYLVGLALAYGIIRTSEAGLSVELVVALGLLGVFALDLVVTVLRRAVHRRPLFSGDRSHMYDQLHHMGWSVPSIALSAAAVQAGLVVPVLFVDRVAGDIWGVLILALVAVGVVAAAGRLGFLRSHAL